MNRMTLILTLAAAALAGCQPAQPIVTQQPAAPEPTHLAKSAIKPENQDADSTLESALQWSAKYAEAAEEIVRLQLKNRSLEEDSRKLQKEIETIQADAQQCQKELTAANAMLLEMRGELNEWKSNVLGFRDEMRSAQQAQLEAMRKILRLLGGEVVEPAAAAGPATRPAEAGVSIIGKGT